MNSFLSITSWRSKTICTGAEEPGGGLDRVVKRAGGFRVLIAIVVALGFMVAVPVGGMAQDVLVPGENKDGTVLLNQSTVSTFAAAVGDRIVLQLGKLSGGAGFIPKLEVFEPDGTRLFVKSGSSAVRVDIQADVQGTYSVVISDATRTGSGTYRLHFIQFPGAFSVTAGDEGGPLANGANQQGMIDLGDLDPWTFDATARDRIVLQIAKISGGAAFLPFIELLAPDGTRLAFDSGVLVARVDVQAPVSGRYTVLVSDATVTGTGGYELHLAQVPESFVVPANDEGGLLGISQKEGTIAIGDLDLWNFAADAGFNVHVQLTKLTGGAGFAPKLELFAPDGQRKSFKQDPAAPAVDIATEVSGTYTILVSDGNKTGSGTYALVMSQTAIAPPGANVLINGGTQLGNIAIARTDDRWTFTASAGENIVLRVGETVAGSKLVPQLRLFSPTDIQLQTSFGQSAAEVSVRATNSGTFTVSVRDNGGGVNTGAYRLSLAKTGTPLSTSPSDEGGTLTNGAFYLGSIDVGEIDAWSFSANAGEAIVIRMGELTAGLAPQLRLYDPSGALLDSSSGQGAAEVAVRATNSGTFLVVASDFTSGFTGSGNYRLSLAKTGSPLAISTGDEGGSMTNGTTYIGSIEVGDIDAWSFSANAGDTIVVAMGELTAGLTPQLRICDPSGALVGSSSGQVAAQVEIRATNSGTFLVVVSDFTSGFTGSGNYRLSLAKTGSPLAISTNDEGGPMTNGTTYIGSIEVGDIDAWSVTAKIGESIVVRMGEITAGMAPYLRLIDPTGVQVDTSFGQVAAEVATRATNNGTFLVIVGDFTAGFAGAGNYRLTLGKTGSPIVVAPGQEGGRLTGVDVYDGNIEVGGLDVYSFTAGAGDTLALNLKELVSGSSLTPWIRILGRDGTELKSTSGAISADVSLVAPAAGTYTVLVADRSASFAGSGTYRLTAPGLADVLKICVPSYPKVGFVPSVVGGVPDGPFTLVTSPSISTPLSQWTSILTDRFDQFGVSTIANLFDRNDLQRFFQVRIP